MNMFAYSAVLLPILKYNLMEKGLESKIAVTVIMILLTLKIFSIFLSWLLSIIEVKCSYNLWNPDFNYSKYLSKLSNGESHM